MPQQGFEKYLFRDPQIRKEVEEISVEKYKSKEIPDSLIKRVFVLPDGVDLTADEKEDFRIYVEYASKRIIGSGMQFLHPRLHNKEKALEILNIEKSENPYISFHDIVHSIITYEDKGKTAPGFATEYSINNIDLIAEELRVNMWEGILSKYSIFIALMDENRKSEWLKDFDKWFEKRIALKDHELLEIREKVLALVNKCNSSSFPSVISTYEDIVFLLTGDVNTGNLRIFFKDQEGYSEEWVEAIKRKYEHITNIIKDNPDPKFLRLAEIIFENYDKNPKILFHEFKAICGKLVENLKKRKNSEADL